jgi:hypothetical protein
MATAAMKPPETTFDCMDSPQSDLRNWSVLPGGHAARQPKSRLARQFTRMEL